jgi:hypothetical protein
MEENSMTETCISEAELEADPGAALRMADDGLVLIGDAAKPMYVLMKMETFLQLPDVEHVAEDERSEAVETRPAEWIEESNRQWREWLPAGWHPLFDELLAKFAELDRQPVIGQAKEKFASLRIYLERPHAEAQALINEAVAKSERTCQVCGRPGRLRNHDGVISTLCDDHPRREGGRGSSPLDHIDWSQAKIRFGDADPIL